jgi:hypothetical protein
MEERLQGLRGRCRTGLLQIRLASLAYLLGWAGLGSNRLFLSPWLEVPPPEHSLPTID